VVLITGAGQEGEVGLSLDVSFEGPLYDGRDRSKGKVRVDISLRGEPWATRRELVRSECDDVRPFVMEKGNPRLCRGDLKSLTNPGVV